MEVEKQAPVIKLVPQKPKEEPPRGLPANELVAKAEEIKKEVKRRCKGKSKGDLIRTIVDLNDRFNRLASIYEQVSKAYEISHKVAKRAAIAISKACEANFNWCDSCINKDKTETCEKCNGPNDKDLPELWEGLKK